MRYLHLGFINIAFLSLLTHPCFALEVYRLGSASDQVTASRGATCLAGGGDDDGWGAGWKYLTDHAARGDVVIIRADGSPGDYNDWIYSDLGKHGFGPLNSVTTLVLAGPKDANDKKTLKVLEGAELVFFAGGDQSLYVDWLKGSKALQVIENKLAANRLAIGGTSAGMALLAGIDYTGRFDSPSVPGGMVTAADVLSDPAGAFVDLDATVLTAPFLKHVITDTHLSQRGRLGRLVGFMARAAHSGISGANAETIRGIGADEATAVCYEKDGVAQVFGEGTAYFLQGKAEIQDFAPGAPLLWEQSGPMGPGAVSAYEIKGSEQGSYFDLGPWAGHGGSREDLWVGPALAGAPPVLQRQPGN